MRELLDTIVFLYEEDITHNIEMVVAKEDGEEITTYEDVIERLKDVKLEDYTKEDVVDRYIAYGTDEEMNIPEVQMLFIKYNFIEELLNSVNIITDKQVIQSLLATELFKRKDISIIEGEIINIDKQEFKNSNIYCSVVTIRDKSNSKLHELKHQVFDELEVLDEYQEELRPYYDNIAVILRNNDNEQYIRCYLKKYEDIDYNK